MMWTTCAGRHTKHLDVGVQGVFEAGRLKQNLSLFLSLSHLFSVFYCLSSDFCSAPMTCSGWILLKSLKIPLGERPFWFYFSPKHKIETKFTTATFLNHCDCVPAQYFDSWLSCMQWQKITFQEIHLKNFRTGTHLKLPLRSLGITHCGGFVVVTYTNHTKFTFNVLKEVTFVLQDCIFVKKKNYQIMKY